ncbi:hypothetical protein HDE_08300 [Halotydeus destructor]|nr:hypothetical protein HDE_08300 [Halotydeus destructor]
MEITQFTRAPDLHICPATDQIFNFDEYNAKFKTSLGKPTSHTEVFEFQSMMTVAQLLEYSPSTEDLLDNCVIRRPYSNAIHYLEGLKCHNAFNVKKYFVFEYICYVVSLVPERDNELYDTNVISYALNFPGIFYELRVNFNWVRFMNYFKLLAAQKGSYSRSIAGAKLITRGKLNDSILFNRFVVSAYKIGYHQLPPPFDTMCRDYIGQGLKGARYCASSCIGRRVLQQLDRHWYAKHTYNPVDKRPVSSNDFKNTTFGQLFKSIFIECHALCSQAPCDKTWMMTLVQSQRYQDGVMFSVTTTNQPSFHLQSEAQLTIEAYLLFVMSCIGSWFGLSILSLSPARLVRSKKPNRLVVIVKF